MPDLRKTLFVSDLHLEEKRPEITQLFIDFLTKLQPSIDALYILGDLFELWVGDDDDTSLHRKIIHAFKTTTQKGVPVYFMYGNRDFLIGKKFLRKTGCQLLADEEKIFLYGTPVLLMHGDTLCTRDTAYLKSRKTGRNRFIQTMFLLLPLKMRKNFAEKMRIKSKLHTQSIDNEIMDVTQREVELVMQKHKVNYLIHGHTHRPAFHNFTLDSLQMTRIVLGPWHDNGSVLSWDETGKKELFDLS